MTRIFGLLLVGAIAFSAVESTRAADGQISDAQLAGLGLGGMQKMSDAQGMAVRGKFVFSPIAILQIATIQYNALQGPLGPQAAGLFATGTAFNLLGVNATLSTRFPTGLNGYGTVGGPSPLANPFIINSIPGQPAPTINFFIPTF